MSSVAISTDSLIPSACPCQRFAAARRGLVERERDHRTASGLGSLHESLGDRPFCGWIKLKPHGRTNGCGDIFNRNGGVGGQNLQVFPRPGRFGCGQLAVFMKSALACNGR